MSAELPLAHVPLFTRLDEAEQRALLALMTRQTASAQEPVFWIGDVGDSLYIVDEGRVVITAPDERGDHVVLDTLGPGGVFGEISLFDGGPRSATVRALTDVTLLVLSREAFHGYLRRHADVGIDMLQYVGARQRASTMSIRGMKNPNSVISESTTLWQRISDVAAMVAASPWFTSFHLLWFGVWIAANMLGEAGILPASFAFDPYPFGLLTLSVSLEATFLAIFVLVSQNRQSERDRIRTDLDYQVNVKAHLGIVGVVERLARIEQELTSLKES